jgi:hypothetical protein
MFVWALHNLRTATNLVHRVADREAQQAIEDAIAAFDQAAPDVKSLRDVLSHYEDYALGNGRLQKPLSAPHFGVHYSHGDDFQLHVSLASGFHILRIEIKGATDAATELFRALGMALKMRPSMP